MAEPTPPTYRLADIPDSTYVDEGLTRIVSDAIGPYVLKRGGEQALDGAWREVIPQWLEIMSRELDGDYEIHESENFTLLLPRCMQDSQAMASHAERSLALILHWLDGIASDGGVGKHLVLCMQSEEDYYQYVSHYDADGFYGGSSGTCFRRTGYTHVVLNHGPKWDQQQTLTHELSHVLLGHLWLPQWVEEGLVQIVESRMHNKGIPSMPVKAHQDYWREMTFAGFWLGSAFHEADEGQGLSYGLAQHMVAELIKESRQKFVAFARSADLRDAGQLAAIEHLGKPLARCLPDFLQIEFAPPK